MLRRTALAVVALAAALTLVACNGDGEPSGKSSFTPTGKPIPPATTPTESETFDPTQETAQEFIRRFIEVENEMHRTGDGKEYRSLATPECGSCRDVADRVEGIYADGGWIKGGERIIRMVHDGGPQWTVDATGPAQRVKESSTADVQRYPGGAYTRQFFVHQIDGVWRVVRWAVVEEDQS